jgi:hypothetical protein
MAGARRVLAAWASAARVISSAALAGAVGAGGYLAYACAFLTRLDAAAPRDRVIRSAVAVLAGVADIRQAIDEARKRRQTQRRYPFPGALLDRDAPTGQQVHAAALLPFAKDHVLPLELDRPDVRGEKVVVAVGQPVETQGKIAGNARATTVAVSDFVTRRQGVRAHVDGIVRPIDITECLGVFDGQVHVVCDDPQAAVMSLLEKLLTDGDSLVTLVHGAGVDEWSAHELGKQVAERFGVEAEVHRGDQPHYPYLIGVE